METQQLERQIFVLEHKLESADVKNRFALINKIKNLKKILEKARWNEYLGK